MARRVLPTDQSEREAIGRIGTRPRVPAGRLLIASAFLALTLPGFMDRDGTPAEETEGKTPFGRNEQASLLPEVWKMVRRGHAYLVRVQNEDGSFSVDPESQSYATSAPIAVTALTCLSFMAGGNTPEGGPYRDALKRGITYLINACDPETGIFHDDLDKTSKMHGQGYAILALAQAYGMFGLSDQAVSREGIANCLRQAVDRVCEIQTEVGGWYYDPVLSSDHEGSITICIVEALRAARNAGIHVDRGVIDRALNYVRRSQKTDGSIRYRLNDDTSSFALTAAGLATLNAAGEYDSRAIDLGLEYMLKKDPILNFVQIDRYPQYARFYAAQAYYQYKDLSIWNRWYPRLVKENRELQYPNGSFSNPAYGPVYATATITLTLQIPFGFLPIFQR